MIRVPIRVTVRVASASALVLIAVLAMPHAVAQGKDEIPFPKDYRSWAHVKTVLVGPTSAAFATEAGFHHIYANDRAMVGYRTGTFPNGSVLVYDLLESKDLAGNTSEGAQRRVDIMVKDTTRFADNAGWGFARFFNGDRVSGHLAEDKQAACLACHTQRRDHDYVHSMFRGDVPDPATH
jgi:hypothetical protein